MKFLNQNSKNYFSWNRQQKFENFAREHMEKSNRDEVTYAEPVNEKTKNKVI